MDEEKLQKYLEELENEKSVLESVCSSQPSAGKLHSMKLVEQGMLLSLTQQSSGSEEGLSVIRNSGLIRKAACSV